LSLFSGAPQWLNNCQVGYRISSQTSDIVAYLRPVSLRRQLHHFGKTNRNQAHNACSILFVIVFFLF